MDVSPLQVLLITALAFAVVVALFAVQNTQTVAVQFLTWRIEASTAVLVPAAAAFGALFAGAVGLVRQVGLGLRLRSVQGRLNAVQARLREVEDEKVHLSERIEQLVEQAAPQADAGAEPGAAQRHNGPEEVSGPRPEGGSEQAESAGASDEPDGGGSTGP